MNARVIQSLRDAFFEAENLTGDLESVSYETFENSRQLVRVAERSLEIVGEALRRALDADPGLEDAHPELRKWIALRDLPSHQYEKIRPEILWGSATHELEGLIVLLQSLLEPLESD